MSSIATSLDETARALVPAGLDGVEVYLKEGRSRRASLGSQGKVVSQQHERGWAVRASSDRSSLFSSGTGVFDPNRSWPAPDGLPIRLPSPRPITGWHEPSELALPLCVEHEALEILEACGRELARELPEARLLEAVLEDGESTSEIANTRGVSAAWRQRGATLFLEAALGDEAVVELVGGRSARAFAPGALARRLADRLLIRREQSTGDHDRCSVLLAPPVAVRIVAALLPGLLEERGERSAAGGAKASISSQLLTLVDDGRLKEGILAAPVDGEGMPTGRTVLIDKGAEVARLSTVPPTPEGSTRSVGHMRRPSFRDLPQVGPSHLFIEPDEQQSVGSLLEEMSRGVYFLEPFDAGRFDLDRDRFEITVGGFTVRSGSPQRTISRAKLSGRFSQLLGGLEAVARDLTFFPMGGLLGSPSLLISGLEVNAPRQ